MNRETFNNIIDFLGRVAKSQSMYNDEAMSLFSQIISDVQQIDHEEQKNNPVHPDPTERMK